MADRIAADILGESSGTLGKSKSRWVVSGKRIVPFIKARTKMIPVTRIKATARIKRERIILFLETKVMLLAYREDKFM